MDSAYRYKNSAGKNAVSLMGGRGTKWNLRRGHTFTAVGYPLPHPSPAAASTSPVLC
jgi:hypothetical protein